MAGQSLSKAQATKLDQVVSKLATQLKIKASDEKGQANLKRFADKYLRNKLGIRGTGPHSHGFDKDQRQAITAAVREAFNIKVQPRKAPSKPAASAGKGKRGSKRTTRRSTAQLAGEQQARASA